MTFWNYLLLAAVFIGSVFVSSLAVLTPLLILKVTFPLIKKTERLSAEGVHLPKGSCNTKAMRGGAMRTLLLWLMIDAIVIILILRFVPAIYQYAVLAGAVIVLLMGLGSSSSPRNPKNIEDFCEVNAKYVDPEARDYFTIAINLL